MEGNVRIESRRFGTLELEEARLVDFGGLPGFPSARRFALLGHDRGDAFAWLLCAEIPDLAFAVTDPWQFFPHYAPAVSKRTFEALGVGTLEELECLVIGTVRPGGTTLNLAAPLLVNPVTRRGLQVILEDDRWSTQEPLPSPAPTAPAAASETPAVQER